MKQTQVFAATFVGKKVPSADRILLILILSFFSVAISMTRTIL